MQSDDILTLDERLDWIEARLDAQNQFLFYLFGVLWDLRHKKDLMAVFEDINKVLKRIEIEAPHIPAQFGQEMSSTATQIFLRKVMKDALNAEQAGQLH